MENKLYCRARNRGLSARILTTMRSACFLSLALLCLIACGPERQTFLLEGSFKGFSQGELYIYDIDGSRPLDTITVQKGQFRYEIMLEEPVIFSIVFPNFSELPVFGEPKAEVEVHGDASHLKETTVNGTPDNKEMTGFRMKTGQMTPPEAIKAAETLIREQPASPLAYYLLHKQFTQNPDADRSETIELLSIVAKAQPQHKHLKDMESRFRQMSTTKDNSRLPNFTATDLNGKKVTQSTLSGEVNIISVWGKWNYESLNQQRQLEQLRRDYPDRIKILSICLDPDVKSCRQTMTKDSVKWSTICTGKMWDTPLLLQLGLTNVPDNIIADRQGKIIDRSLRPYELFKKARDLLKPKTD